MGLSVTVWPQYIFVTYRQTYNTDGIDDSKGDPLKIISDAY
jgi:hypothetical protein